MDKWADIHAHQAKTYQRWTDHRESCQTCTDWYNSDKAGQTYSNCAIATEIRLSM